jgi:tetratricopeptide (TPR) repeat protein
LEGQRLEKTKALVMVMQSARIHPKSLQRQGLHSGFFLCLLTCILTTARAEAEDKHPDNPEKDTSDAIMADSLVNDYQAGRYSEALELARKMLKINPGDHAVRLMAGDIYARLGQYAYARTEYEGVINSAPESQQARYARAALAKLVPGKSVSPSTVSAINNQDMRNDRAEINQEQHILEERDRELEQKRKDLAIRIDRIWEEFDIEYPGIRSFYANGQTGISPMPHSVLTKVKAALDKKIENARVDFQKQLDEIEKASNKRLYGY